jgi:hypothetical protein
VGPSGRLERDNALLCLSGLRLCNRINPYWVVHLPNMEIPLITYLLSPTLRGISKKKDPRSFFAIPTPPCVGWGGRVLVSNAFSFVPRPSSPSRPRFSAGTCLLQKTKYFYSWTRFRVELAKSWGGVRGRPFGIAHKVEPARGSRFGGQELIQIGTSDPSKTGRAEPSESERP